MKTMTSHELLRLKQRLRPPLRVMVMRNPDGLIVDFPTGTPGEIWSIDTIGGIEHKITVRLPDGRIKTARDSYQIEPSLAAAMLASVRR